MVIKTSSSPPVKPSSSLSVKPKPTNLVTSSPLPALAGTDFLIPSSPKRQACVLIFGDAGAGKTSFAVRYAPDPVAIINFDRRATIAIDEARKLGKVVYELSIDLPPAKKMSPSETKLAAREIIEKVVKNFIAACDLSKEGKVRSILLDTATEYSEIVKLAFDGVQEQTKEGAYGKDKDYVNRQWWRLFNIARSSSAHLIVTSRAKEVWIENVPTGRFSPRCPGVILDGVDWAGNIRWARNRIGRLKGEQELEITKAVTISELGEIYTMKDWEVYGGPFVYGCVKQYGGSLPEDWI